MSQKENSISNLLNHKEQLNHVSKLQQVRPVVNSAQPWKPSYSLSRIGNKYSHTTESNIAMRNNILLSKMMEIQKRNIPLKVPKAFSSIETLRKREKHKIVNENEQLFKRILSANSTYSKKNWMTEIARNQKYRENLQRRTSIQLQYDIETNDDFNLLAKEEQLRRSQTSQSIRKRKKYYQYKIIINKIVKTSQGGRTHTYESLV
ncbi:hypothetical protein pb186bvf_005980 [Paramecium bursaria]